MKLLHTPKKLSHTSITPKWRFRQDAYQLIQKIISLKQHINMQIALPEVFIGSQKKQQAYVKDRAHSIQEDQQQWQQLQQYQQQQQQQKQYYQQNMQYQQEINSLAKKPRQITTSNKNLTLRQWLQDDSFDLKNDKSLHIQLCKVQLQNLMSRLRKFQQLHDVMRDIILNRGSGVVNKSEKKDEKNDEKAKEEQKESKFCENKSHNEQKYNNNFDIDEDDLYDDYDDNEEVFNYNNQRLVRYSQSINSNGNRQLKKQQSIRSTPSKPLHHQNYLQNIFSSQSFEKMHCITHHHKHKKGDSQLSQDYHYYQNQEKGVQNYSKTSKPITNKSLQQDFYPCRYKNLYNENLRHNLSDMMSQKLNTNCTNRSSLSLQAMIKSPSRNKIFKIQRKAKERIKKADKFQQRTIDQCFKK